MNFRNSLNYCYGKEQIFWKNIPFQKQQVNINLPFVDRWAIKIYILLLPHIISYICTHYKYRLLSNSIFVVRLFEYIHNLINVIINHNSID